MRAPAINSRRTASSVPSIFARPVIAQFRWKTQTRIRFETKRSLRPGRAAVMSQILLRLSVQANRSLAEGSILGTEASAESGHSTDSSKPPGKCEHGQQMVAALPGRRGGDHRSLLGDARGRGGSRVPVPDSGAGDPHGRPRASLGEQMNADPPRRLTIVDGGEQPRASPFEGIVGRVPAFRAMLEQAARVATVETTVLLTGESGTGKELVARAIHNASRRTGPFVAVNCAALPETLVESELFGHERGAFTGADRLKRGRFELAERGTLLLDEIAELAPAVQAKLLRALEEREYERVGGTTTLRADVRLIAATNHDPDEAVREGRIRADLYYRLAVFRLHLAPLRERNEDVLLLADHFLRTFAARMGRPVAALTSEARDVLLAHDWPGNVRELQNAIERALVLSEGAHIAPAHLGLAVSPLRTAMARDAADGPLRATATLAEIEKRTIVDALRKAKGIKSRAAAALGLSRGALYTRLRRFGLNP